MISWSALLTMLNGDARKAMFLDAQAMQARERKDWLAADRLYRTCHDTAAKLKEPRRTHFQAGIEIRWASVLHRLGRMRSAEDSFREGLVKANAVKLRLYPAYNFAYMGWADLCMDEERFQEAVQHYGKVVALAEQNQDAGGLVFGLQRLADALIAQGRRAEAEEVVNRTITLETQVVHAQLIRSGKDPAKHQITSMSLPDLHFSREQYEDARRLYREKVEHWEKQVTRPDNIDVGRLQMRLAFAEARTGHVADAIEYYSRAEATYEREWCEGHPKALAARRARTTLAGKAAVA